MITALRNIQVCHPERYKNHATMKELPQVWETYVWKFLAWKAAWNTIKTQNTLFKARGEGNFNWDQKKLHGDSGIWTKSGRADEIPV